MQHSSPISITTPEFNGSAVAGFAGISLRSWVGLLLLMTSTLVCLAVAWLWPGNTLLHFGLVAQFLPVFYALLAWWWARQPVGGSDEL